MPKRKSVYLSGRGFSTYIDLKDSLPDISEALPDTAIQALKDVAEKARAEHEGETPMKTGKLRDKTRIVGYKNGSLGGTVYIQWLATDQRTGFHYGIVQEQGRAGDNYFVDYTTPGTGPGFMKATWETVKANLADGMADTINELIKDNPA